MGDTLTISKNFLDSNSTLADTLAANRSTGKNRSKPFDTSELSNVKKIVLELPENHIRGRYHQVEYIVQLIDRPTKWYLQGEMQHATRLERYCQSCSKKLYSPAQVL